MNFSNIYYTLTLASFLAVLWWQGRGQKNQAVESVTATLVASQNSLISTQAERIALLENQNKEQAATISKQHDEIEELRNELRILKEAIHGSAEVVHKRTSPVK